MAELKRDKVNRQALAGNLRGSVILPLSHPVRPGTVIRLKNIVEQDIDCSQRDPSKMVDPHLGTGTGDAIFDAAAPGQASPCDAGIGTIPESFYILAEDGGIMTHGGIRYTQERE